MRDEPDNHRRKAASGVGDGRLCYTNGVSSTMSRSMHHADIPAT
jgi:hypothetical protein